MNSHKVLLIGCGQLGSRHLQAIARLPEISQIHVIDPNPEALALGKRRLSEIDTVHPPDNVEWHTSPDKSCHNGSLCIVATQAPGRVERIKEAAEGLGYRRFLIEKIVTQSVAEYQDLLGFSNERGMSVWVNCQLRTFDIYRHIKERLAPGEPIIFSRIGGNQGLANNGAHTADLFLFLDGSNRIEFVGARIDPVLHPSRRNPDISDLSGALYGKTAKGSDFMLAFSGFSKTSAHITVLGGKSKFMVSHFQNWAYESCEKDDWQWKPIAVKQNMHVSHTTTTFAGDILSDNRCSLPTLAECLPAHEFILTSLLPTFNELTEKSSLRCPVT
ncbi:hypothetical protein ACFL9U_02980 [Thermodesulfobacteriota bacterium]